MRLCNMCGASVPENSSFCKDCGARYDGADASPPNQMGGGGAFSQEASPQSAAPMNQLKTNRSLIKFVLFSIITIGIYTLVFYYRVSEDINITASRYDGKKTLNFLWLILLAPITLGIAPFVWFHRISNRAGNELSRRGINSNFSAGTYWLIYGGPTIIYAIAYWVWFSRVDFDAFLRGVVTVPPLLIAGSFAVIVLMCVYVHKLCEAFNQLSEHYNVHG